MSARKIIVWTPSLIIIQLFSRANCKNSKGMAVEPFLQIPKVSDSNRRYPLAGSKLRRIRNQKKPSKNQALQTARSQPNQPLAWRSKGSSGISKASSGSLPGMKPKIPTFHNENDGGGESKVVGWWSSLKVWWRKSHSTGRCLKKKCWINIHKSGRCTYEHLPVEYMKIPFINVFLAFLQSIFSSWYVRLTHQMLGSFWTYPAVDAWCTYRPKLSPAHKETNLPRRPKLTLNLQDETHKIVPNLSFNQSGWNWQDTGATLQIPEILDRNHFWQFQIWDCLRVWYL